MTNYMITLIIGLIFKKKKLLLISLERFVMINFIFQLDWDKSAKTASETLFLDVSVRLFPEETAFESVG